MLILASTDSPKGELEGVILSLAAPFDNHVSLERVLIQSFQETVGSFHTESERQFIWVVGMYIGGRELLLSDYGSNDSEIGFGDEFIQPVKKNLALFLVLEEHEGSQLLPDFVFVQHNKVMTEVMELEFLDPWDYMVDVVHLPKDTEIQDKDSSAEREPRDFRKASRARCRYLRGR